MRLDGLPLADDADVFRIVEGHPDGSAQRNLFLGETAECRVGRVDVSVVDVGVGDAVQRHALFDERGIELIVGQRHRRELLAQIQQIKLVVLESQPRGLLLFDDADLDTADLRHLPALHRGDDLLVEGIAARLEMPGKSAEFRVRFEDDLVRSLPLLEPVGSRSDGMAVGVVRVGLDNLSCHRAEIRKRHDVGEVVVGFLELDQKRVSVERLHA